MKALLEDGLQALGIASDPFQIEKLLAYLALLHRWNQCFNLTALHTPLDMVSRHVLDSAAILPYLNGERIIDVGTGAGLPGIPLSILCPEKLFFLLDSNQKKQVFVLNAVNKLFLSNVKCITSSVQIYQPEKKFSTIVSRAFASLPKMLSLTHHLVAEGGCFLAMLGKLPEKADLPAPFFIESMVELKVPGEQGERHLAIIKQ